MAMGEGQETDEPPLTQDEKATIEGWASEKANRSIPILIDGEEYIGYYYDDHILFKNEGDGKVWGIMRNRIKSRGPVLDKQGKVDPYAAILAWEVNGEIKSVEIRVSPKTPYITFFGISGTLVI